MRVSPDQPHCPRGLEEAQSDIDRVDIGAAHFLALAGIEERDRDLERLGDTLQPAGRNAVDALLVFLDLLKRHIQQGSEISLRQAALEAQCTNTPADLSVSRISAPFLLHLASTNPADMTIMHGS